MILVIPTAGLATRMLPLSYGLPKVLVSHHDKPIFHHILNCYRELEITKVILVISPQHRELFDPLIELYRTKYQIELVVQPEPKGLLDAVICGLEKSVLKDPVVVHLSDAIFDQCFLSADFERSFVAVTKVPADQVQHWCMVQVQSGEAVGFVDKPFISDWSDAITGVYYFSDPKKLYQSLAAVKKDHSALASSNISTLLRLYSKKVPLDAKYLACWWDMGTLSHLHRQQFCHVFDGHQVQQHAGQITKSGTTLAIKNELFYYQNTLVLACFPRLDKVEADSVTMQYVSTNSLAYWFLWQQIPDKNKAYIVEQLWQWISSTFYQHVPANQSGLVAQTEYMYGERVIRRLEDWRAQLSLAEQKDLFQANIKINGKRLLGWEVLKDHVLIRAKQLSFSSVIRHIHGDLHCANILYDPERHIFTCLDPRGAWGNQQSIWGDIRYDAAKFLHSFHGSYEYIKNRLSLFEEHADGSYVLQTAHSTVLYTKWLDAFCMRWSIAQTDVLWIEGLCLLAISKLYQDKALQKQFFLQGLLLLNSLL